MKSNAKPFVTPNPQDFKLRIVWSLDASSKMVAEFSNSNWLPRIGETLVLPIEEADESNSCSSWRKFKVFDIIYDFQHQTVRVICEPKSSPIPQKDALSIAKENSILVIRRFDDRIQAHMEAMEGRELEMKANELERKAQLEYELSQITEEDVDDELEKLKRKVLDL